MSEAIVTNDEGKTFKKIANTQSEPVEIEIPEMILEEFKELTEQPCESEIFPEKIYNISCK